MKDTYKLTDSSKASIKEAAASTSPPRPQPPRLSVCFHPDVSKLEFLVLCYEGVNELTLGTGWKCAPGKHSPSRKRALPGRRTLLISVRDMVMP